MPKLLTTQAQRKYEEFNAIRRNLPHMTSAEIDAWVISGKDLREFLGVKRFIEKGWRINKNGDLKLR